MPVTIDGNEVVTDDGKFTEHFGGDSKELTLERVPDLGTMKTRYIEATTALSKKMEGVIQKPGEDASDEDKSKYRDMLHAELGAAKSVDDYDLAPAEGVQHDEELVNTFKEFFLSEKVPPDVAKRFVDKYDQFVASRVKTIQDAENAEFEADVKAFKSEHPGDKMTLDTRIAAKAMLLFGPEGLTKAVKEGKMVENSADLEKWRKLDVWPAALAGWTKIGEAMKSDDAITNEGEPRDTSKPEAGTVASTVSKVYTHPTSVQDRKTRGKDY